MSKMNILSSEAAAVVSISSFWAKATFNAPAFLAISSGVGASLELDSTSSLELETTTLALDDFGAFSIVVVIF